MMRKWKRQRDFSYPDRWKFKAQQAAIVIIDNLYYEVSTIEIVVYNT